MKNFISMLDMNSPVVLSFTFACFISMVFSVVTGGASNELLCSVYRSSFANPLTYLRLFTHVIGHINWEHFMGNIMLILILGPLLEEKYGSVDLAVMIAVTALVTGVVHILFFPNVRLLGASGVVFAMILASSITRVKEGTIPLTFVLVAVLYIGKELYGAIFVHDNVSQLTHIVGGGTGAAMALFLAHR